MSEDKKRPAQRAPKSKKAQARQAYAASAKGARRRQSNASAKHNYGHRQTGRNPNGGISITVQIPPLRRPGSKAKEPQTFAARLRAWRPRRALLVPVAGMAVALCLVVVLQSGSDGPAKSEASAKASARTEASFSVLTPKAEQASAIKYDGKRDLATYTTNFSGVGLTVSQQPLPKNFAKDPSAALRMAESIKAKQQLDTAKGKLYIATNEEAGDQFALFASTRVLVLLHADGKLDDASWKSFVELLVEK